MLEIEQEGNDSLSIEHKEEIHILHKSIDLLRSSILNNNRINMKSFLRGAMVSAGRKLTRAKFLFLRSSCWFFLFHSASTSCFTCSLFLSLVIVRKLHTNGYQEPHKYILLKELYCILLYWRGCHCCPMPCDLFKICCAPLNLGIATTWTCRLNFAQRPNFFRFQVF